MSNRQKVYARGEVEVPLVNGNPVIIEVPSSDGKKIYHVDLTNGRCSCLGWTRHCNNGKRKPCKHLQMYNYVGV